MNERTLYFLRHGEADPAIKIDDIERPLSFKGKENLNLLLKFLIKEKMNWELEVCSTALRTRESLEILSVASPNAKTIIDENIYNSSEETIYQILRKLSDKVGSVLIVGHNPSLRDLGIRLAFPGSDSYQSLVLGFPPGSLLTLKLNISKWSELREQSAYVESILKPRDFYQT